MLWLFAFIWYLLVVLSIYAVPAALFIAVVAAAAGYRNPGSVLARRVARACVVVVVLGSAAVGLGMLAGIGGL